VRCLVVASYAGTEVERTARWDEKVRGLVRVDLALSPGDILDRRDGTARSSHCPCRWRLVTESPAFTDAGATDSVGCFMSINMPHELDG